MQTAGSSLLENESRVCTRCTGHGRVQVATLAPDLNAHRLSKGWEGFVQHLGHLAADSGHAGTSLLTDLITASNQSTGTGPQLGAKPHKLTGPRHSPHGPFETCNNPGAGVLGELPLPTGLGAGCSLCFSGPWNEISRLD